MNTQDFIKLMTKLRLENKHAWFWWEGIVNGKKIRVRGCDLNFQIFTINGLRALGNYPLSVKQWKEDIIKVLGV